MWALLGEYEFSGDAYPMASISEVIDSPLILELSRDSARRFMSVFVDINPNKTRHFIFFGDDRYIQLLFNGDYNLDENRIFDFN